MPSVELDLLELLLELGDAAIGELAGALVLAFALGVGELGAQLLELGLELLRLAELLLLRLPSAGDVGGALLEVLELLLERLETFARAGILLLLERLLLDAQPHDFAVDVVELLGLGIDLHLQPRRRLVDEVDRLVGQEAVGDVAVRQRRRGDDRGIGDDDAVMLLVAVLEAAQDRYRVGHVRLGHEDRLEPPRQRRVLLDVLLVLVEGGRADAVQLAARQRRLEQVRRIHGAVGLAGADQRVHLVDEQDDLAARARHLLQHRLEALLELAAILRAGDERAHVEGEQLLVGEALGDIAVDDAQREPFDDRGLADARLADQHRIVLGAAGEHLDGAPDLLVAADHRIELAVARRLGEVAGVFLERVIGVFGGSGIGGAALAQRFDRGIEVLRRDPGLGQDLAGLGILLDREREQQALDGDVGVARLLGDLLGGVEHAPERRLQIDLAGAAAFDLGTLGERRLVGGQGLARAAAGAVDEARGQSFGVVEQDLEQMLGRELLMTLALRQRLCGLHEAAGAVGVFLEIHWKRLPLSRSPEARPGLAWWNGPSSRHPLHRNVSAEGAFR